MQYAQKQSLIEKDYGEIYRGNEKTPVYFYIFHFLNFVFHLLYPFITGISWPNQHAVLWP